jgi:DNA-binding CsgD family transcriptional regulator
MEVDALIDPKRFVVAHAEGAAKEKDVTKTLRAAAKHVDHARSKLRASDPDKALEIWQGLIRGRWSLVDWFDSDGRRFVVVVPNAPGLGDPRGLTEREHQVATYAALGESSKLISYRLGVSKQRVSLLLQRAMKKLGAKTRAELVVKMRAFRSSAPEVA